MSTSQIVVRATRRYGTLSPLRYPGGKAALAGLFADVIGDLNIPSATYVEPYAGGAGAGIALLRQGLVANLVINDIDPAVHAFWNTVVSRNSELVDRVQNARLNVDEWRRQRDIYRAQSANEVDLGFAFFYLNRTNRSGVLNAGVIGGQKQNGNYKIDARFNKDTLVDRLTSIGALADKITVTALDGRTLIREYDHSSIFMYIDPPYVRAGSDLYLNAFQASDHVALASVINQATSANWLLTYDIHSLIERLYASHFQCQLALTYSARYPGAAKELLVASPGVASAIWNRHPIVPLDDESAPADQYAAG